MPVEVPMPMTFSTRRLLITTTFVIAVGVAMAMPAAGQDAVKKGQDVYTAQKCQLCHVIAGKGNKSNPLDGVGAKLSAADIKEWIAHPKDAATKAKSTKKPPMPDKYGSLPAADLDALLAYMQSLK
jgi:mono/diheme cytochrome c family protein